MVICGSYHKQYLSRHNGPQYKINTNKMLVSFSINFIKIYKLNSIPRKNTYIFPIEINFVEA